MIPADVHNDFSLWRNIMREFSEEFLGNVVGKDGRTNMPFTEETIDRLDIRLSASALTLLRLAWRDRSALLTGY